MGGDSPKLSDFELNSSMTLVTHSECAIKIGPQLKFQAIFHVIQHDPSKASDPNDRLSNEEVALLPRSSFTTDIASPG